MATSKPANPNPNPNPNPNSDAPPSLHRPLLLPALDSPPLNPNPNPNPLLPPNPNPNPLLLPNPNPNPLLLPNPNPNPNPSPAPDVSRLLQRLSSLEQSVQQLLLSDKKQHRLSSEHHILHNLEQQMRASSSPRIAREQPLVLYPSTLGRRRAASPSPNPNPNPKPDICVFQMPLHYPRYSRNEYESMPEWKIDLLLQEYGLPIDSSLSAKRNLAIGNFLWM